MQKQKKGFWLFIFSLIPGAGEMYMGFKKQGISIMLLFWSMIAVAASINMGQLVLFLPIIWFYSFFNVHNLKSLSEEEFRCVEDTYILHLDKLIGDADHLLSKYRTIVAVLLIVFGISILWNNLISVLTWILPRSLSDFLYTLTYHLPQIVIAVAIILAGLYILSGKKKELDAKMEEDSKEEHYWEPYRPYQQPKEPERAQGNVYPTASVNTPEIVVPGTAGSDAVNSSDSGIHTIPDKCPATNSTPTVPPVNTTSPLTNTISGPENLTGNPINTNEHTTNTNDTLTNMTSGITNPDAE